MIRLPALSLFLTVICALLPSDARAQADYKRYYDEDNLPKVRAIFDRGGYDLVVQICDYALRRGQPSWEWRVLRFESLANQGLYDEAAAEAAETASLFRGELGAQLRIHQFFRTTGRKEEAAATLADINTAARAVPVRERTALDLVHLAEAALILGADPSKVIAQYLVPAKATKPKGRTVPPGLLEAHLFSGRIALEKEDLKKAGEEFGAALKLDPESIDALFGMAEAFLPSDRKVGMGYLERTLEEAPLHFGALLMQAEYAINYEKFEVAGEFLSRVESVNPRHPEAHAYRAVLAELERNDREAFAAERESALSVWRDNPEVDYLIGRVLSRKYRYAEGAESQKRALAFDPHFLPAKLQLALDYLRLGKVEDAWPLAREVAAADPYNVLAYNLEILEKEIASFASVESADFIVRLPPEEAELYGDRVVDLLTEAKEVLGSKYGLIIEEPTLVEFYPNQQDFAIRSFGSLGGEGLLGVCFGSVVTMNSPGSRTAGKNNWEATLWHEYCHVITLTATRNKMPRWLSEGISVYEEKQRNPRWGQDMSPDYRRMILEEESLTPIRDMSQAFFQPKTGQHIMFAYYQSMLVVEYLIENFGLESLRAILADLADGVLINDALERHTLPLDELEGKFSEKALQLARAYGPDVDWTEPDPKEMNPRSLIAVSAFLKRNPSNFQARRIYTSLLLDQEQWDLAIESADELIALLPEFTDGGNGYSLKALALRGKKDTEGEAAVLELLASKSAEAFSAYTRLIDMNFEDGNWDGVIENAHRGLAINPFVQRIHYCRGCAHEAREESAEAVGSFENALLLNPVNPSEVRFRLARLLQPDDKAKARRYLLDSLADSPRYREAHALLLDFHAEPAPVPDPAPTNSVPSTPGVIDPFGGSSFLPAPQ